MEFIVSVSDMIFPSIICKPNLLRRESEQYLWNYFGELEKLDLLGGHFRQSERYVMRLQTNTRFRKEER